MGKRSTFDRVPRDYYPTPASAVEALADHLPEECTYIEPCAGDGALINTLTDYGHHCLFAGDIEPRHKAIHERDARTITINGADFFITNPPWSREILHPIISNLCSQLPTWLLIDADWAHTKQAAPYLPWTKRIVAIGRVKWIPDSPYTGKDNCCWYLFDQTNDGPTLFYGRQ
jgi:hypothetical protein